MTALASTATAVSDDLLVDAACDGDLYAWEHLVRRYQEPAFRFAYLLTRATKIAETATQAAFIRAYRALPDRDEETALAPWLYRIVIGETRQQRRESGRTRMSSRPDEQLIGPHVPASAVATLSGAAEMTPLEREAMVDAFDRLNEEDRLIIASRYLFNLSAQDAAATLSLPSGLVEEHLQEALAHLRERMTGGVT